MTAPGGSEEWEPEAFDRSPTDRADLADRFVSDARIEDEARARRGEHALRHLASTEAGFADLCWDLAERGDVVSLVTTAGGRHRGVIRSLGTDFLGILTSDQEVLVPFASAAIVAVADRAGGSPRPSRTGLTLAEALAEAAAERPAVRLRCLGGEVVAGELVQGGRDVAAVSVDDGRRRTVYVRLSSLAEASLLSG